MAPAHRLLLEFVAVLSSNDGHAALRQRGGSPGYVHVVPRGFDPARRGHRHVLVELYNGTVGVTEELKDELKAQPRSTARIEDDPLGYSAGPNYGRFRWGITHTDLVRRWGSERAFVEALAAQLRRLGAIGDDGEPGDYE
jgi:hypothetical protein